MDKLDNMNSDGSNDIPYTTAFKNAWKEHLTRQNRLEYLEYTERGVHWGGDYNAEDIYMEFVRKFIIDYIQIVLTSDEDKNKIIMEFGFQKLIGLMCEYNGEEICDELFEFKEYKEQWIEMLMHNVLNVYT